MNAKTVRKIVGENRFMTIATADAEGRPWASPVWYATVDCLEFFWVSKPDARHSQNIYVRPELAIVIFDSQQQPGTGAAVYLTATAEQVMESELERGIGVYSGVSRAQGIRPWARVDVEAPAQHRLYRALAAEHFMLNAFDERVRVDLSRKS